MLKTLRLHNFRTFLNAEVTFTDRHLVIGKNNAGKTNLCAALVFLRSAGWNDLSAAAQVVPGGVSEIRNWALAPEILVELSCTCELPFKGKAHLYTYELQLRVTGQSVTPADRQCPLSVARERLSVQAPGFDDVTLLENDGEHAQILNETTDASVPDTRSMQMIAPRGATMLSKLYESEATARAVLFKRYLLGWVYFALSPEAIRRGWLRTARDLPVLLPGGDNLAIVLYYLKNADERRYRRVIEHARLIEPDLEVVNFFVSPDQIPIPVVGLRQCAKASWAGLSDGTLRALALAVVAEGSNVGYDAHPGGLGQLVVIEEPENGIFPGQLRAFFERFEERATECQFIFTSHSPYFIDLFDAYRDSVTLLRRNNERTEFVHIPPPDDDPDRLMLADQYSMELFD